MATENTDAEGYKKWKTIIMAERPILNRDLIVDGIETVKRVTPTGFFNTSSDKKIIPDLHEKTFEAMIDTTRLRRERDPSQNEATIKMETNLPWIAILNTGDWHIGSERCDYEAWHRDMSYVKETDGLFMNILGDERDNFVTPKFMRGADEHVISPQQQAEFIEYVLRDLDGVGKIMARTGGNHDHWTWLQSGIELEDFWYKEMKSPLFRNGGFLHLELNGTKYEFYLHHGLTIFNSNFNPNHATKRAFEFQGPFDVGAMGHSHVAEIAHGYRWTDSHQKDYVQMRTGTYKIDDQYARSRQLGRGQPAGATVLLNTVERRMIPFLKLEDAVSVLKGLNRN